MNDRERRPARGGAGFSDRLIRDFSHPGFQAAFRRYFSELGIAVKDWQGLFREMNGEEDNIALLRETGKGETVGFIQFKPIVFTSWFFEERCGFIRELWVAEEFRRAGHGCVLLAKAEECFAGQGIYTAVLTTDTAGPFYEKHGYQRSLGCRAKNGDEVWMKRWS